MTFDVPDTFRRKVRRILKAASQSRFRASKTIKRGAIRKDIKLVKLGNSCLRGKKKYKSLGERKENFSPGRKADF